MEKGKDDRKHNKDSDLSFSISQHKLCLSLNATVVSKKLINVQHSYFVMCEFWNRAITESQRMCDHCSGHSDWPWIRSTGLWCTTTRQQEICGKRSTRMWRQTDSESKLSNWFLPSTADGKWWWHVNKRKTRNCNKLRKMATEPPPTVWPVVSVLLTSF